MARPQGLHNIPQEYAMNSTTSRAETGSLVLILTLGVFSILNTEMGVIGMLPLMAESFQITVPQAGWTVTIFALVVALSGPVTPMLFSSLDRRSVMLLCLGVFMLANAVAMFTTNFAVLLAARAIPAFFHPVYVSLAFTVAAASVPAQDAPKAVARVFIGVSAGMVLGVPAAGFIAGEFSYAAAMFFFLACNALAFAATLFRVPSLPVSGRRSYGQQLRVLRKPVLWFAVGAVALTNGAVFGFFSYLADYLKSVTGLALGAVSMALFIFGVANILGNILAGWLLARNAPLTIRATPFALAVTLGLLFTLGAQALPMLGMVLLFGILTGISSNNNQYLLAASAPEAPEFANGLFLSSANWGTAFGTALCGIFIDTLGTRHAVGGALLCLAAGTIGIFLALAWQQCRCRTGQESLAPAQNAS